jgi:hypothetical protein
METLTPDDLTLYVTLWEEYPIIVQRRSNEESLATIRRVHANKEKRLRYLAYHRANTDDWRKCAGFGVDVSDVIYDDTKLRQRICDALTTVLS